VASLLEGHIGANVIVKNMTGAGGLRATNHAYGLKRADGLDIVVNVIDAMVGSYVMEAPGVKYELGEFKYIGAFQPNRYVLVAKTNGPYASIDALRKGKGIRVGGVAPYGWLTIGAGISIDLLNLDAKLVPGYRGTTPMVMAVLSGELDVTPEVDLSDKIRQKLVKVLFAINQERNSFFPDVPAISELVDLSDQQKSILDMYSISSGKVFFTPPNTPIERVNYLQGAFNELNKDKGLRRSLKKVANYYGYLSGEEVTMLVKKMVGNKENFMRELRPLVDKLK